MQQVKGVKVNQQVKIVKRKFCIKKTHVYNNCYELRSRAIKKSDKKSAKQKLPTKTT